MIILIITYNINHNYYCRNVVIYPLDLNRARADKNIQTQDQNLFSSSLFRLFVTCCFPLWSFPPIIANISHKIHSDGRMSRKYMVSLQSNFSRSTGVRPGLPVSLYILPPLNFSRHEIRNFPTATATLSNSSALVYIFLKCLEIRRL